VSFLHGQAGALARRAGDAGLEHFFGKLIVP
jgi:hypothetical protein